MSGVLAAVRYVKQAPVLFALLIVGTAILAMNRDRVTAEWRAMYPTDARMLAALQLCYTENHQFNRMSNQARDGCYERWLPRLAER